MGKTRKDSCRQRIINLKVGRTVQFPVEKLKSIRAMTYEIKRANAGLDYATTTTPSYIKVTCTARPTEPAQSK